jgi:hypothetical protein
MKRPVEESNIPIKMEGLAVRSIFGRAVADCRQSFSLDRFSVHIPDAALYAHSFLLLSNGPKP